MSHEDVVGNNSLESAIRELLACPVCHHNLTIHDAEIRCVNCFGRYSINEGIPNFLTGELTPALRVEDEWHSAIGPPLPKRHWVAHLAAREPIADVLRRLGCDAGSLILSVATGTGVEIPFLREISESIVAVDVSGTALREFRKVWPYLALQAEASRLPFRDGCFDAVIVSALLHHVVGYSKLSPYLLEFARVARNGGIVIAVEPNAWYPFQWFLSPVNRVMQHIRPGWRGLVPHERPLSPHFLVRQFNKIGLSSVDFIATTFTHNRLPERISNWIKRYESPLKIRAPFRSFGWWVLVWGRAQR